MKNWSDVYKKFGILFHWQQGLMRYFEIILVVIIRCELLSELKQVFKIMRFKNCTEKRNNEIAEKNCLMIVHCLQLLLAHLKATWFEEEAVIFLIIKSSICLCLLVSFFAYIILIGRKILIKRCQWNKATLPNKW